MPDNKTKKKVLDVADKILNHKFIFGISVISLFIVSYYVIFARPFFLKKYIFPGDSYYLWSFNYISLLSIKNFNALPWWDPTSGNGFPAYFHFISGMTNYLSPFYLPSLLIFKAVSSFISINTYIIFHRTLYVVLLNITAIYLISRELVVNRAAAILPVLIFSFSFYQVHNFHDCYALEAMIAPLFYLYALIRYNNTRNNSNLLLLFLFAGIYFASINVITITSAFFWTGIFTFLLLVFNPSLIKDTFNLIRGLIKTRKGKVLLPLALLLMFTGFLAAWLPSHYNAGHVVRYRGSVVDYGADDGITDRRVVIEKSRIWTILSNWLPFPEVHDKILSYAWHGHSFRYIGLITLPLILAAFILDLKNRYVFILFLTYFLCNGFIIYTTDNVAYKVLIENTTIFKNIRNMMTLFPRGQIIFLVFLSAIGLDRLIGIPDDKEPNDCREGGIFDKFYIGGLKVILFFAFMSIIAGIIVSHPKIGIFTLKHTFFHWGFYLVMFSFLCWILFLSPRKAVKNSILLCLFMLTFTDLTISVSSFIDQAKIPDSFTAKERPSAYIGRIRRKIVNKENWAIPDSADLIPAFSESENIFPAGYTGFYHNPIEVYSAIKEWLVLSTREKGRKFLTNWNQDTLRMKKYPEFKFYSNGYYLPFEAIKALDTDETIFNKKPLFYLHDKELISQKTPESIDADYKIEKFSFNETIIRTKTEADSFLCYLDNYDRFWSAYIDDEPVKIHRANFCFKAIKLPAGEHTVSWIYNPSPIKTAYLAFYLSLIIFLIGYFWFLRPESPSDLT